MIKKKSQSLEFTSDGHGGPSKPLDMYVELVQVTVRSMFNYDKWPTYERIVDASMFTTMENDKYYWNDIKMEDITKLIPIITNQQINQMQNNIHDIEQHIENTIINTISPQNTYSKNEKLLLDKIIEYAKAHKINCDTKLIYDLCQLKINKIKDNDNNDNNNDNTDASDEESDEDDEEEAEDSDCVIIDQTEQKAEQMDV
jgi:hypothetical protein